MNRSPVSGGDPAKGQHRAAMGTTAAQLAQPASIATGTPAPSVNTAKGRSKLLPGSDVGRLGWRWTGRALVGIGVFHQILGLVAGWSIMGQAARDGLLSATGQDPEFASLFWFLFAGVVMIMLGLLVSFVNSTLRRPAPVWLGWWFVGMSLVGLPFVPVSGFWLTLALGIWMILAARPAKANAG
ncbi:MAG: DUF6463 family protein [Micrococcales bacterium]|nr:DUF6463 family protein [Micrococcales bacterium]